MKFLAIRWILRPGRLFFWMLLCSGYVCGIAAGLHRFGQFLRIAHPSDPDEAWLNGVVLFSPAAIGWLLADVFREPLHRRFAGTLPGIRRRFVIWHATIIGLIAIGLAVVMKSAGSDFPPLAVFGWAIFALAVSILSDPVERVHGFARIWRFGLPILLLVGMFSYEIAAWFRNHSLLVFVFGLGGAIFCFVVGYNRERLRRAATRPWTSWLSKSGSRALATRGLQEDIARRIEEQRNKGGNRPSAASPLSLCNGPLGAWKWVGLGLPPNIQEDDRQRIVRIFNLRKRACWWFRLVQYLLAGLMLGYFIGIRYSEPKFYQKSHFLDAGATFFILLIVLNFYTQGSRLLSLNYREPISRRQRLQKSRAAFWTLCTENLLCVVLASLGFGCGFAWRTAHHFEINVWQLVLVLSMDLVLFPLVLWSKLANRQKGKLRHTALGVLRLIAFFVTGTPLLLFSLDCFPYGAVSAVGIATASAVAFCLYFLCDGSLKKYFLEEDLITRPS